MSIQSRRVLTRWLGSKAIATSVRTAGSARRKVLEVLKCGELTIDLPGGRGLLLCGTRSGPRARLAIHSWRVFGRLLARGEIGFAQAYMAGEWSSPNLVALLTLVCCNRGVAERVAPLRIPRLGLRLRHALNRNTRHGSRRNIAAHYDLGNEFYKHWLDAGMTYSAGLFSDAGQTLTQAQEAKLDRVLDLLELREGDRVLEIGCGWGSFAERLLETRNCTVTGVTLSTEQLAYAQRRLDNANARGRCDLRLQDYRDVQGTFDRIASIEMLEAVGAAYWPTYFAKLRDRLRPDGIAVLQIITIDESRYENYRRRPDFIQRYVFPGGMLPTKSIIEREIKQAGLQLVARELFGTSYARTLQEWNARFRYAWPKIQQLGFDERFRKMWEYYLAYCQVGFDVHALDVGFYKIVRCCRDGNGLDSWS
jgi:cyclopropane-fatty-acyl-phospholipid synthase